MIGIMGSRDFSRTPYKETMNEKINVLPECLVANLY